VAAQCSDSVFALFLFSSFSLQLLFLLVFYLFEKQGFLDSEQSSLANELLVAFDECDDARLAQTLKDSTFNLLDAPVCIQSGCVCLNGD
jgi:hypothetical protein